MRRSTWLVALLLVGRVIGAQAPAIVRLDDAGLGPGPTLLAQALARPHTVIPPGSTQAVLPRDSVYKQTVIVLGRETVVDGTVEGDVIVIGKDLHLHPRSVVTGRAVAIGGGVYESALARSGGVMPFRDFTYDISPISGGYSLRYRSLVDRPESAITLPGFYGLRVPTYDRSNGLSVAGGVLIAVPRTELLVEPRVAYRSQIGQFDPAVALSYPLSSRTTVRASAERGTFTNEGWIWPDWMNSASALFKGRDTRNYYRATRAQLSASKQWGHDSSTRIEPYIGARWERDRSVRPDSFATGGPWSFSGRHGAEDMLRPNPRIDPGDIFSGIGGALADWESGPIHTLANLDIEIGGFSPQFGSAEGGSRWFAQATFDGRIVFPTFGVQTMRIDGHLVMSAAGRMSGDRVSVGPSGASSSSAAPRQRWAYVGGSGSIGTLDVLERGGDQLLYLDARYNIPIERIQLPLFGPPILTIREILAGADVGRFPSLAQATGLRLGAAIVYVEVLVDPVKRDTFFSFGVSLVR